MTQQRQRYQTKGVLRQDGQIQWELGFPIDHVDTRVVLKSTAPRCAHPDWIQQRLGCEVVHHTQLRHVPWVVPMLDTFMQDGSPVLVFPHFEGTLLRDYLQDGPISAETLPLLALDLCRAVAAVQSAGYVHLDVHPSRIVIGHDGVLRLYDLSSLMRLDGPPKTLESAVETAAPELLRGDVPTFRADVYSVGITLLLCILGIPRVVAELPSNHSEDTASLALDRNCWMKLPDVLPRLLDKIRAANLPKRELWADLIENLVRFNPTERPASVNDVIPLLLGVLSGDMSPDIIKPKAGNGRPNVVFRSNDVRNAPFGGTPKRKLLSRKALVATIFGLVVSAVLVMLAVGREGSHAETTADPGGVVCFQQTGNSAWLGPDNLPVMPGDMHARVGTALKLRCRVEAKQVVQRWVESINSMNSSPVWPETKRKTAQKWAHDVIRVIDGGSK